MIGRASTRLIRGLTALAAGAVGLAAPASVAAHTLNATYASRLPLAVYLAGAGATVALSFAFVLLRDLRAEPPVDDGQRILVPAPVRIGLRALGLIAWLWIVVQGILGGGGDGDVGSLFLWVYGWVGLAMLSAFVGPVWHWLDPFSTLHDILAALLRAVRFQGWPATDYPAWLSRWPAAIGFAFFVWLELPMRQGIGSLLFTVLVGYTIFTLAMMAQFGRDEWRSQGETFTVWFRLLNRIAPYALADENGLLRRRPYGMGLLEPGWSMPDVMLVAFGVGSIIYDGLSQTRIFYDIFGFPSAAMGTVYLMVFLGVIVLAAFGVARLVGVSATGAGLLPIAVGYLIAHYLTYLLIDGQRILVAISDPFQRGWDLFGTAFHTPTGSFLDPGFVWTVQLAAVVGGHMVGAWAGHVAAARDHREAGDAVEEVGEVEKAGAAPAAGSSRDLRLRQIPLALVMVTLTTVTLWSLGQAIVTEEPPSASIQTAAR